MFVSSVLCVAFMSIVTSVMELLKEDLCIKPTALDVCIFCLVGGSHEYCDFCVGIVEGRVVH